MDKYYFGFWMQMWKAKRKQTTMSLNQTNATNVTMSLLGKAIWGDILKRTVEKNEINANNVTLHILRQVIWGDI